MTNTEKNQLDRDVIRLAYQLFLGREGSEGELDRMQEHQQDFGTLRRTFLNSREFHLKYGWIQPKNRGSAPLGKAKTIIHLHVPKSAGSTLTAILAPGSSQTTRMTVGDSDLHRLKNLPQQRRSELEFVFGHLSHGVANLLPNPCLYVTVLREPGTRLLSYFRYIQRVTDHPLHGPVTNAKMTFGDFLEYSEVTPVSRMEVDNGQVRRLAGQARDRGSFGKEAELLRSALHNIFADDMIYGFTEHFDDLLGRLKTRQIIPGYQDTRLNTAPDKTDIAPVLAQLTPAQKALFDQFTYWDDQFYGICKTAYFAASP